MANIGQRLLRGFARFVITSEPADHVRRYAQLRQLVRCRRIGFPLQIICVGGREIGDAAVLFSVDQRTDAAHRCEPSFDCEAYEFHGCPEIKQTVSAGLTCSHYPVNGSIRFALEIFLTNR